MCGLSGELRFDGQRPDREVMMRMMAAQARRGPDDSGDWCDGPVAFGHRRLAIIDLSPRSHQPMLDPVLGNALVFNGTIYNYRALRADLQARGHAFSSEGDTEVILRAYAEWGEACVDRLEGMFAFALWDAAKQQLFLARDRIGIKPLYLSQTAQALRFASSTQALLAAGEVDTRIDAVALHHQFTLHASVPAPRTLLRGIRKLPPAHTLTVTASGQRRLRRYWSLAMASTPVVRSDAEWLEMARTELFAAVKRREEAADVPVGVLLSGGLDSSLLVALLAQRGGQSLQTFSLGFEDHPEEPGDEFEYSDLIAKHFGTRHHRVRIADHEVLERLPEAVDAMAEPMFSQDNVAFYLLSEQVSRQVKVVQSGQGADEVFGGYFWYPQMQAAQGSEIERFASHYFDRDHAEWRSMIAPNYHGLDWTRGRVAHRLASVGQGEFLNRVLAYDATELVVDDPVKRVDNMTMAWGLEARVPFLDPKLMQALIDQPPSQKLAQGGKALLKTLSRGLVPDAVIDRKKGYFPVPVMKFLRGAMLDFVREVLNSPACRERGLYQRAYVDRLLQAPERHFTRLNGNKLWHLALVEFWLQRQVDGASWRRGGQ